MPHVDTLIVHATLVTCDGGSLPKRGDALRDVGLIADGAAAIQGDNITAIGPSAGLQTQFTADNIIDAQGNALIPGFVDPHTHLVYAGDRIDEFEMRIQGRSYMEIMAAGGGIRSTMHAVRAASVETLKAESLHRLNSLFTLGTTTVEIKTGYGLDLESELKMLHVIEALDREHPIDIVPTFMGAHAVPPEMDTEPYVRLVIEEMLPAANTWYRASHFAENDVPMFVDVFCEENAFDLSQTARILDAAIALGLPIKAHVDEFTSLGGVQAVIERGGVSVDHLDASTADDIALIAQSETAAVVIPAVNFNLGSHHYADARALADQGAILALTTDINPGSAPCPSMPLVMSIACRYQHLLPSEALNASTVNAAYAIGIQGRVGVIRPGMQADMLLLNTADYRHLAYQFGDSLVETVIKKGKIYDVTNRHWWR